MTAGDGPGRPDDPDWTGFVLLIVPVEGPAEVEGREPDNGPEPVKGPPAGAELVPPVRDRVGSDVVLADTVRVAGGPVIRAAGREEAKTVANALVRAALDGRRAFAPQLVFGCVLVGPDQEHAEQLARELAQTQSLTRLPLYCYGVGVTSPDGTAAEVAAKAFELMESYERWPDFVIGEQRFLGLLRDPATGRAVGVASSADRSGTADATDANGTAGGAGAAGGAVPGVASRREAPVPRQDPTRPGRWRTLLSWRRRSTPTPTHADALDRLARSTDAVALVHLVLVADSEPQERRVRDRRTQLVVELDRVLATLGRAGPDRVPVETGLYTAGRSLVRHGPLRPAGQLRQVRLSKTEIDYVDLVRVLGELDDTHRRDLTSLARREIDVPAASVVFLSTFAPLADSESVDRIRALGERCQVTWLLLGVDPDLVSEEFTDAGVLVLDDHPDVVHEFMERAFGPGGEPGRSQPAG